MCPHYGVISIQVSSAHEVCRLHAEISPGAWVAVENPEIVGFSGGVALKQASQNPGQWTHESQGFGLAVMHQIHCVVRSRTFCKM